MTAFNVPNRKTPGFRAKDLVLVKELLKAYHNDRLSPLRTLDIRHFSRVKRKPIKSVIGRGIHSFNPDTRLDKNTINPDEEMAKIVENQLMYQLLTRKIGSSFQTLKCIIAESGK